MVEEVVLDDAVSETLATVDFEEDRDAVRLCLPLNSTTSSSESDDPGLRSSITAGSRLLE
jgi:hypothetical protein